MVCVGVRGLHMRMGGRKHVIVGMNLGTERLGRETRTRLGNGTPRHGRKNGPTDEGGKDEGRE